MKIKNPKLKFPDRKIEKICERWYGEGVVNNSVHRCLNPSFYQADSNGLFFCKKCAHAISNFWNKNQTFTKIYIEK